MKKILFTLMAVLLSTLAAQAATKYEINVGGIEVTSDNMNSVTGGSIKSGTINYNPSTNVLTLINVRISCSGSNNYGVHNRDCDNLTIRFVGTCTVECTTTNALHLDRPTTVEIASGSILDAKITSCENLNSGVIYVNNVSATFKGPGMLNVIGEGRNGDNPSGFEGTGMSSSSLLTFNNININIDVYHGVRIYNFRRVVFQDGSDVKMKSPVGVSSPSQRQSAIWHVGAVDLEGNMACVTPADAYYMPAEGCYGLADNTTGYLHFTDNYGLIITTANFPDANFRKSVYKKCSYIRGYGQEQYLTKDELANLTTLYADGMKISSLTGIEMLINLDTLYCGNNSLSSLNLGNTKLTYLNCNGNNLLSLNALTDCPSTLTYLSVGNCNLSTLDVTSLSQLENLYCNNNRLTDLNVMDMKELQVLNCYKNSLTSLSIHGCTNLQKICCSRNQITDSAMTALVNSLPTRPISSLGYLYVLSSPADEGNFFTEAHLVAAQDKNWIPMQGGNVDITYDFMNGGAMIKNGISGDVNCDNEVSIADINTLINVIFGADVKARILSRCDVNEDCEVSLADINTLINIILNAK